MNSDHLPVLIGRWSVFEDVAWDLVSELEVQLELARDRLSSYEELGLIEHRLWHLKEIARLGL